MLAFGGHTGPPCPPNASCAAVDDWARDGAAYDPGTDTSVPLPNAPLDLDQFTPLVAASGFVYDDRTGAWAPLGHPDTDLEAPVGVWLGERLLVLGDGVAWLRGPPPR